MLDMLICVCAALDARAAAGVRPAATATLRDNNTAPVPAPRAGRLVLPGEKCVSPRRLLPGVRVMAPKRAATPEATPAGPWLAWSRDTGPLRAVLAVPWRPRRETRLSRRHPCTPLLFLYCNKVKLHCAGDVVAGLERGRLCCRNHSRRLYRRKARAEECRPSPWALTVPDPVVEIAAR